MGPTERFFYEDDGNYVPAGNGNYVIAPKPKTPTISPPMPPGGGGGGTVIMPPRGNNLPTIQTPTWLPLAIIGAAILIFTLKK